MKFHAHRKQQEKLTQYVLTFRFLNGRCAQQRFWTALFSEQNTNLKQRWRQTLEPRRNQRTLYNEDIPQLYSASSFVKSNSKTKHLKENLCLRRTEAVKWLLGYVCLHCLYTKSNFRMNSISVLTKQQASVFTYMFTFDVREIFQR